MHSPWVEPWTPAASVHTPAAQVSTWCLQGGPAGLQVGSREMRARSTRTCPCLGPMSEVGRVRFILVCVAQERTEAQRGSGLGLGLHSQQGVKPKCVGWSACSSISVHPPALPVTGRLSVHSAYLALDWIGTRHPLTWASAVSLPEAWLPWPQPFCPSVCSGSFLLRKYPFVCLWVPPGPPGNLLVAGYGSEL